MTVTITPELALTVLVKALQKYRYAGGYEGINCDGEVAWLSCTCGWSENWPMPQDDITLAEDRFDQHRATHLVDAVADLEGFSDRLAGDSSMAEAMAQLRHPVGDSTVEWGVANPKPAPDEVWQYPSRVGAQATVNHEKYGGTLVFRTRTAFPDVVSEWTPAFIEIRPTSLGFIKTRDRWDES